MRFGKPDVRRFVGRFAYRLYRNTGRERQIFFGELVFRRTDCVCKKNAPARFRKYIVQVPGYGREYRPGRKTRKNESGIQRNTSEYGEFLSCAVMAACI